MIRKLFDKHLWRFLLVGVANSIVGNGAMFLLYNLAGWSYWASSVMNYILGGICSYFLNKYFTFQNKEHSWKQVGKFILTVAVCYLIAYGVAKPVMMRLLSGQSVKFQENAAMVVGMGLYMGLNYMGQRFFAFRSKEEG